MSPLAGFAGTTWPPTFPELRSAWRGDSWVALQGEELGALLNRDIIALGRAGVELAGPEDLGVRIGR